MEHQRLELALGAGRMGAYDMDMRDNVLWWSAQTYRLFGVSEQDFVSDTRPRAGLASPGRSGGLHSAPRRGHRGPSALRA